jgi:polyvinyl alcohol dehydrogenase (cytochrome)
MRMLIAGVLAAVTVAGLDAAAEEANQGKAIYETTCANCHDKGAARAPTPATLKTMEPVAVVRALETGVMRVIGTFSMSGPQRIAVAEYVTGKKYDAKWRAEITNVCPKSAWPSADPFAAPHWNGWGADQQNTRFQPAERAKLEPANVPKLKLQWAFAYPGETLAEVQPVVVDGRIFVGSRSGAVYSLDSKSGCTHWMYQAGAAVKGPVLIGKVSDGRVLAFFGDVGGRAYAIDAANGEEVWKIVADTHPSARLTGGFQLVGGKLYVPVSSLEEGLAASTDYKCCTFRGSVMRLDALTGKVEWKTHTIVEEPTHETTSPTGKTQIGPNGGSVWSAPTIDEAHGLLYVSTGDNYSQPATDTSDGIMAMKMDTGEIAWVFQGLPGDAWNVACSLPDKANCPVKEGPDHDMGSSPILVTLASGKRVLMGGQKTGILHAIDPDAKGKILWQNRVGLGGIIGGIEWGSATDGKTVYVAVSDAKWDKGRFFGDKIAIDPKAGGGLAALDVATGTLKWRADPVSCAGRERCSPAQSQAVTAIPGVVFSGAMSGVMRAFDAETGKVVWTYDTVQEFKTVNGASGRGGTLDQGGPAIVDGWVYINSGYTNWGGQPGNVLLAFKPE